MQPGRCTHELTPETVLQQLQGRIGAANGITARDLVYHLTWLHNPADERRLRQVIEQLRRQGHPICGHPQTGYHLAANPVELDRTCEFLFGRALSSLEQISALKKIALPDLRGQLGLPLPQEAPHVP
jgi:hypothetical protein